MPQKPISKLAEIRLKAGLTQATLAALVGVSINTIQNWEKKDGLNQLRKYLKLGEIFGLENLNDFFEYVEVDEYQENQKGFSLEQLRRIREEWKIDINNNQNTNNTNTPH